DRHAGQVPGALHGRVGGHEYAGRGDGVEVGIELAVPRRRRHADRPVARTADIRRPALLERLEGADPVALVMDLAVGRLHQLTELILEAFRLEVALLLGHPLLQPEVRLDDEFRHSSSPRLSGETLRARPHEHCLWTPRPRQQQSLLTPPPALLSPTRRERTIPTCSSISRRAPAPSRIWMSPASGRCTSRIRRATAGVSVRLRAGQATCASDTSGTVSTRLCEASATAR